MRQNTDLWESLINDGMITRQTFGPETFGHTEYSLTARGSQFKARVQRLVRQHPKRMFELNEFGKREFYFPRYTAYNSLVSVSLVFVPSKRSWIIQVSLPANVPGMGMCYTKLSEYEVSAKQAGFYIQNGFYY